jgi:tripartite-type tricarboxylate transporter receptor subunit TctC
MNRPTGLFFAFCKVFLSCFLCLQSFPIFSQSNTIKIEGPLKLVIPFGPGSGTDVYARMIAQSLSQSMGTSVIIDNRPGASPMETLCF